MRRPYRPFAITTFRSAVARCGVARRPCKNPCRKPFPSDPLRSFTNACSPRRSPVARPSARSASWCGAPSIRRSSSPRWARQPRPGRPLGRSVPPPRPSTRIAGMSIVARAPAGPERSGPAHRSAARPSPGGSGPDHPPPGARSGRTGAPGGRPTSRAHCMRAALRAARALGWRAAARQAPTYSARCSPVRVERAATRSAGVPSKTIRPPSCPAPGPRSMIQSACAITAW
jgi:hypothetical protein